jgi:hypothetical protein
MGNFALIMEENIMNRKRVWVILAQILACGLMALGCNTGNEPDNGGRSDDYAQYYEGDFRNNRNGTVEVVNNTQYDMLLFTGETISPNYVVGGVKAGSTNTVNFSNESDYTVGGYKLLRAVKQSEYALYKDLSRIDHTALITYRDGAKFRTNIVSTTDGAYQYTVYNRSRDYGLELRKNSTDGDKVAYLTRGEVRRVINSPTNTELTLYPVWVAYNKVTKSIVTFSPSGNLEYQDVQPKNSSEDVAPYYFPYGGSTTNIVFDNVELPFATIQIRNNAYMNTNFRVANTIRTPESGYTGITSGARESYEIKSTGEGMNLNLAMNQQQIIVPIRFADGDTNKENDQAGLPIIRNGYVYTVSLVLVGSDQGATGSYTAVLEKGDAIDKGDFIVSN